MDALLGEAGVVEDEHAAGRSQLLAHEALQLPDAALIVPRRHRQELLQLARRGAHPLGDVLRVLALDGQRQPDQVAATEGPPFRATEEATEARVEALQRRQQDLQILVVHGGEPSSSGPPVRTANGSAALRGATIADTSPICLQPAL